MAHSEDMTREDIHEAAKNDDQDGVKPGGAGEPSEAGGGFNGVESDLNGADAIPESTTGVNNPGTPKQ